MIPDSIKPSAALVMSTSGHLFVLLINNSALFHFKFYYVSNFGSYSLTFMQHTCPCTVYLLTPVSCKAVKANKLPQQNLLQSELLWSQRPICTCFQPPAYLGLCTVTYTDLQWSGEFSRSVLYELPE